MKNRKQRVDLIVSLIRSRCIGSQEELAALLEANGFRVTQATLSRDLKLLKTTKIPTDRGAYIYILPDSNYIKDKLLSNGQYPVSAFNHGGFVSLEFSGNLAVVKTRRGYASGMAYDLDVINAPEFIGTIPGADTIFLVLREGVTHERAREVLSRIFPLDNNLQT